MGGSGRPPSRPPPGGHEVGPPPSAETPCPGCGHPTPSITHSQLAASRWDAEYRGGRYRGEAPLPFVADILTTLDAHPAVRNDVGLYVGCGNGRNYLPLVDAGLRLYGLDLSLAAIRQLAAGRPSPLPLICGDFRAFAVPDSLGYLVAIQVFQHGTADDVATYFANAAASLRPGGLFFLRVNAASTQILHAHTTLERRARGGTTIRYDAGPKRGLAVHFYGRDELTDLTQAAFEVVMPLRQRVIHRAPPALGFWAQWEAIWRRR